MMILKGKLLDATRIPGIGCIIVHTNIHILMATVIFSMGFDIATIFLTAYKLLNLRSSHPNGIAIVLLHDGLVYFICAYELPPRYCQITWLLIIAQQLPCKPRCDSVHGDQPKPRYEHYFQWTSRYRLCSTLISLAFLMFAHF